MKSIILSLPVCALIFAPYCATAASTLTYPMPVHAVIPDNNDSGLVSIITVAGSGQTVVSVEVAIATQSGWNGDMYAYLEHNGVISVLLNRPGRTLGNPAGAASSGMQLSFADSAPADVHTAIAGTFGALASGTYQPDARAADPGLVTDASTRSLYLYGFDGQIADGDWTLFVADLADGEVATLSDWSLSVTVVPEPSSALLVVFGAVGTLLIRRRKQ
jgi:subtilisin-like proprotein convertase family protein